MQYVIITIRKDSLRFGSISVDPTKPFTSLSAAEEKIHEVTLHGLNPDTAGYVIIGSDGAVYRYDHYGQFLTGRNAYA